MEQGPYYGLPKLGWIIELTALRRLGERRLPRPADFEFLPPLGTADRTRHVKVTTLEETQHPGLHLWIEEASRTPSRV